MSPQWKLKNEGGAALVIALGVMSVMIITAVTVTALSMNSSSTISNDTQLTESQNIAEAGVDDVIAVTLANFEEIYPGRSYPDAQYPGDGMPFYDGPQEISDGQGNVSGTYEVWTKEDPDRPGNVLITAIGSTTGANPETATVRVSVMYTSSIFDYVLLPGTPTIPTEVEFMAGNDDSSSHGSTNNMTFVGNVHINGNANVSTPTGGDNSSGHAGEPGTVSFLSRDGYNDSLTYTNSFTGDSPTGNQPVQSGPVNFPRFDQDSLGNTYNLSLSNNGALPHGWVRSWTGNKKTFTISAEDFENAYGGYDAVIINSSQGQSTAVIYGNCDSDDPAVITSTIVIPVSPGNSDGIGYLNIIGPGVALRPDNGLAILAPEGDVQLQDGVEVGQEGAGALIFLSGQDLQGNQRSELEINGNFTMYGSIVVNSDVTFGAISSDHDSGSDDDGGLCDSSSDTGSGGADGATILVSYDSAFLRNMPPGWWDGGDMTAVKVNYERG